MGVNHVETGGEWHFEGYSGVIGVETGKTHCPWVCCLIGWEKLQRPTEG